MKSLPGIRIIIPFIFIVSLIIASCSSHMRETTCKGNNTYRGYIPKKNKSRYRQIYGFKSRSVKKDYVIKNGIAH